MAIIVLNRGVARKGGLLARGACEHGGIPAATGPRGTEFWAKSG